MSTACGGNRIEATTAKKQPARTESAVLSAAGVIDKRFKRLVAGRRREVPALHGAKRRNGGTQSVYELSANHDEPSLS